MKRLDVAMAERGLTESREQAQRLVMAGAVLVNGQKAIKPSLSVTDEANIEILRESPYVSRGGFKLEKALNEFAIRPEGRVAADIGASTGGFSDCMLQRGADKVYAVDVGYGQLHQKLRSDPRVVVLERTNARYLSTEQIPEPIQMATIDVAFISLKLILPPLIALLAPQADVVALVKPQFEAEARHLKKGVVRDAKVHEAVLRDMLQWVKSQPVRVAGLSWSPITGPKGNIEFLLHLKKEEGESVEPDVAVIVRMAHEGVKGNPME